MPKWIVERSQISGSIAIPASKSHSMRALLFASLASGTSHLHNILDSPDIAAMRTACELIGAKINFAGDHYIIQGLSGYPEIAKDVIDAGNSGQVLRFMGAIAALSEGYTVLTGDRSLRTLRPIQPLIDGLKGLGAFVESTQNNGHPPLIVKGPLKVGPTSLSGEDSQPVSALLMATSFLDGETVVSVKNPGEKPWIDMTLSWLSKLGVKVENNHYRRYCVYGSRLKKAFTYHVPADFSSAAFPLAAAVLTGSCVTIPHLDQTDVQGDKKIIELLQAMGAHLSFDGGMLHVRPGRRLSALEIDVNEIIDALPILAIIGTQCEGKTILRNAAIARRKESDRISTMASGLQAMGAKVEELEDGLIVHRSELKGATLSSHADHRIALAFSIAGMLASGKTVIQGIECSAKSFPDYAEIMSQAGAKIKVET